MKIYTEKELAQEFGISPWTIRLWRTKGNLPHFRTAGRIFYRMESVLQWMADRESSKLNTVTTNEDVIGL